MRILVRPIFFLCAAAMLFLSIAWCLRAAGIAIFASSFCVAWFIMGSMATLHYMIPFRFPDGYYRSRPFEADGRFYRSLGILHFRRIVRRGPLHALAPAMQHDGRRESLRSLEAETRKAETVHVLAFLATLLFTGFAMARALFEAGAWTLLFNLMLNPYPILLQRFNRRRLEKLA